MWGRKSKEIVELEARVGWLEGQLREGARAHWAMQDELDELRAVVNGLRPTLEPPDELDAILETLEPLELRDFP